MLRVITSSALVVGLTLIAAQSGPAQCPEGWRPGEGLPGLDGPVYARTVWDDGTGPALFVAGEFTIAGSTQATGIARWNGIPAAPLGAVLMGAPREEPFFFSYVWDMLAKGNKS